MPNYLRLRLRKGWKDPNSTAFARDARPGPVAQQFELVRRIPGWFTYDDVVHFTLVLRTQSYLGLHGDILEIGTYHGRSTALLAGCLAPGECLTVCDPFQVGPVYVGNPPTAGGLRANVASVNPDLAADALEVFASYSSELQLPAERRFRFIHIDGSHVEADVLKDLHLARKHLLPGGVIACDDFEHPDWPGVSAAITAFRSAHPEFRELADINRYSESGRKLYLVSPNEGGSSR
jgi:predicted O-methyltransferase YrrM